MVFYVIQFSDDEPAKDHTRWKKKIKNKNDVKERRRKDGKKYEVDMKLQHWSLKEHLINI